jgi:hypothetical protein
VTQKREYVPVCISCDSPLTVERILIGCTDFSSTRAKCLIISKMCELFCAVNFRYLLIFYKTSASVSLNMVGGNSGRLPC